MLRFLADENFNRKILRGLLRRIPDADIVRAQDVGLRHVDDRAILDWAAREGRLTLTHDMATLPTIASERVAAGKPMRGVVVVPMRLRVGRAIDELEVFIHCSFESEWEGIICHLPF